MTQAPVSYLSAKDIARLLKISVRTVWRLTTLGHLPRPVRIGTKLARWREQEVHAYLERRNGTSDADVLRQ